MKYCIQIIVFSFGLLTLSLSHDVVAQIETNCADGKDNDNDGDIDCADDDCNPFPLCSDESINCSDGRDNDGDGDVDCYDDECDCTQIEICNNYIDDNGDGLIDCQDTVACADFVGCERECNNGVDDDGDGFFDYYDGDCLDDPNNPNDYLIIKPDCEARPQGNVFDVNEAWRSADKTANNRGMPAVADIDGDGTPEVITINENKIFLLNGIDGATERVYSYPNNKGKGSSFEPLTVGDIDNDGYGEIFHYNTNNWIRAMDYDPGSGITTRWTDSVAIPKLLRYPGLADFNRDGKAELYYVNEIRDAATGTVLVAGSHGTSKYPSGNDWEKDLNALPVAVDILPDSECTTCDGLELVLGHIVYAVDIAGGKLTEVKVMDAVPDANKTGFTGDYYAKTSFNNQSSSTTAVVDYNQDGFLDVLMSGAIDKRNGPSAVFFWDVNNNSAKAFIVSRPGSTIPNKIPKPGGGEANFRSQYKDLNSNKCDATDDCTWQRGVGSLNIASINIDSKLECTFMSGSSLYAIDQNMNLLWANHTDFWESTSGITGTAVFDFDGDGASEVIYRDQVDLYVVDGENGQVLNSQYANLTKCSSNTAYEYPIVADVDGDGETEVIVTCSTIENNKYESATTNGGSAGHVRVYKASEGQFWVPARSIWNQFTYFNVNVNDNMTIPRYQQPHHLNFSEICSDPNAPNRFSLNKFLNQSPRITFCGDLAFPASKLDFADDGVIITPPICPEDSFKVQLIFENTGDYTVNQPVPFSFYAQDPTLAYSNADLNPWLDTVYVSVPGGIKKNQKVDTTLMIRAARGQFTLYASMNDIGPFDKTTKALLDNADFYPLDELNGTIRECDGTPTVKSKLVDPIPFEMIVSSTDNRRCENKDSAGNDIGVNNGKIKITDKDGNPLTPLSNYVLSLINTKTNEPVDISGSVNDLDSGTFITNLDSGTYTVSAQYKNDAFSCGSIVDTVTLKRIEGWPEEVVMSVEKLKDVSSCKPGTADGEARVLIDGVAPDTVKYKVRWQNEEDPLDVFLGSSVKNLEEKTYLIFVTNRITGCELNDSSLVMDLPRPVLDTDIVEHSTSCSSPNGTITAKMASGPIAQYGFQLIQKSPLQDTTFSDNGSFTDLAEGIYELIAYDPTNDCGLYSEGVEVTIETQSTLPELTLSQVSPQTACEPALANGHLRATPSSAGSYSYTWYKGTVTTGPTADTVGIAADATGLSTYNNPSQLFTVVMVDGGSGCSVSDTVRLFEQLTYPEIDPADVTTRPLTRCDLKNGQIIATVGGNNTDYTFRLYEGFNASGSYTENITGIFSGLDSIHYTLVAEATATGCFSTGATQVETIKVPSGIIYPETLLDITPVNQTSCSSDSPNGEIIADITGGDINDYDFIWYKNVGGVRTEIAIAEPTAVVNDNVLSEVRQGNYVLEIITDSTGCSGEKIITLYDDIVSGDDILLDLTPTAATRCAPPDGSISVTRVQITRDGGTTYTDDNISDYQYRWYHGSDTTTRVDEVEYPSAVTANLVNVPPGEYTVVAFNPNTTCPSVFYTGIINGPDRLTFDFNASKHGSSGSADPCINPDGTLEVQFIVGGSGNYTFQWYLGEDTSTPIPGATSAQLNGIRASRYTVEITDIATGCATDSTFSLGAEDNLLPTPATALKDYAPSTSCNPSAYNGILEVEVDPAIITASYPGHNLAEHFFYYWFEGDRVKYKNPLPNSTNLDDLNNYDIFRNAPNVTGFGGAISVDNTSRLENLAAGEYTVVVIDVKDYVENYKLTGTYDINLIGCRAIDTTYVVEEIAQSPSAIAIADNNETCPGEGNILVTAGKQSSTAPIDNTLLTGYDFLWTDENNVVLASTEDATNTVSTLANLVGGRYTVTVTDRTTKCDTTFSVDISDMYTIGEIDIMATSKVTTCNGSEGSVAVTAMTDGLLSDYTFTWFSANYDNSLSPTDAANTALIVTDANSNDEDLTDQEAGTYWVVAQHNTTLCYSLPRQEIIVENAPVMYIPGAVPAPFITCTGTNDGQITVEIMDAPGAVDFKWFTGQNNINPADEILTDIDNTTPGRSTINNLVSGEYTVQAIDLSVPVQACPATASFTVGTKQVAPVLTASKLSDQTVCNADGSIRVSGIQFGGTNADTTQYTLTWYKGSVDPAGKALFATGNYYSNPTIANQYDSLDAGVYFIQAEAEFSDGCLTDIEQVIITDQSTVLQVTGKIFNNYILACDPSQFAEGEIEIEVLNSTNFTTAWYRGEDVDETQRITGLANDAVNVLGLAPDTYTVKVTDTDTGCEAIRQYTIQGISIPLAAFPSAQPLISCMADDGAVGVTINGGRGNYTVRWYAGADTLSNPINPNGSYVVEDLSSGIYTVAVTDKEDLSCGTVVEQITVVDRSSNDVVLTVGSDRPMTNCDDGNPNGQLSAEIENQEDLFRYEFFWYAGNTTSGNPIAFGPTATKLGENTYTVIARDRVTGCLSDPYTGTVVTILDSGLLPAPVARMLSPVTRCTDPNGSAEAILDSTLTVDPNIDYEFIWYNTQDEVVYSSSRTNVVSQLDTGSYSVIVRNTITGCLSAPGLVYIGENIYVPEFEITSTPSFCGQPSGTLSLVLNEPFDVVNIEWTTPYGFNNGFFLDNQPAGNYVATLTDASGCQITQEARVLPGIQVYNAVSPNGDQKNDIFTISCIGDFENNIVRIYNRAGSLVYEHEGYDNETIFFEGYGNRGVYVGRKELPDGTYFYIVDKRNGDEPESGYLELLR